MKFDLFREVMIDGTWYIKVLSYTPKVWSPWRYLFYNEKGYPVNSKEHATGFVSQYAAAMRIADLESEVYN